MLSRLGRAILLALIVLPLWSCERRQPMQRGDVVIVRVYRDRNSVFASQLDRKFYDFTSARHRVSSGKWILVATAEPYQYKEELGWKVSSVIKPQMIILDDPADATLLRGVEFELDQARSACPERNCPGFIPRWVSGEELEAARQVFAAVTVDPHL